jgi:site-specific DNA-methyltransferase (adenine-specific)
MIQSEWPPKGIDWYYADDSCAIACGDCREILPLLPPVDLVLTDPPYGIDHTSGGGTGGKWHNVKHQGVKILNDNIPFDPSLLLAFKATHILWGANFYSDKLPGGGWLIWDKRLGIEGMEFNRSDSELAYFSGSKTVKTFRHLWHGLCRDSEIGQHLHPTQKPVALMKWCISLCPTARTLLDPYCGSGPALCAAKDLGLRAIGIEINPDYCAIARDRLRQEVFSFEEVTA